MAGDGFLDIDQSTLTGESLPVKKQAEETGYSGSIVKQGEMIALVAGTGLNTKFANTAKLVETAGAVSHFQKAVLHISDYLIYLSLGLAVVLVLTQLARGDSFFNRFPVRPDPGGGGHPGGHAGGAVRDHGPGRPGPFQEKSDRHPAYSPSRKLRGSIFCVRTRPAP